MIILGTFRCLGRVGVEYDESSVTAIHINFKGRASGKRRSCNGARHAIRFLTEFGEYLAGRRRAFSVKARLSGVTPFQARVLEALREIEYGSTVTYGELASWIGAHGAARAVGNALGRNPLPILYPCHRVVAAGGIGGFGPGIRYKKLLLNVENSPFE